jgi:HSP20 family protein
MAIIRWNPWSLPSLMDEDLNLPTIPGLSRLGQGLNLYETDESVVAEAALPGVPLDRIDVSIDEGVVRITGSTTSAEEKKEPRRYYMTSLASSYNYSFRLPEGIAADKEPEASFDNGVLKLTFTKMQKAPPKKIKISKKSQEETRIDLKEKSNGK